MIDLHFCPTPNCWKIAIMLEELGVPYNVVSCNIFEGEQLRPDFAELNLNRKVPVIVDHDPAGGGGPFVVFESGAILLYLATKAKTFIPADTKRLSIVQQWLIWQVAGLGPMFGQANHFLRYAREKIDYAIERYRNEAIRLVTVLDTRLSSSRYLADDYSIADMAVWPWIDTLAFIEVDIAAHPHLHRWYDEVGARPAVKRAYENKRTAPDPLYLQRKAELTDEQWSIGFGERQMAAVQR